jgi:hypothetical protein
LSRENILWGEKRKEPYSFREDVTSDCGRAANPGTLAGIRKPGRVKTVFSTYNIRKHRFFPLFPAPDESK